MNKYFALLLDVHASKLYVLTTLFVGYGLNGTSHSVFCETLETPRNCLA